MKGCPDLGVLRAHAAGELGVPEQAEVVAHLQGCARCRRESRLVAEATHVAQERLAVLGSPPGQPPGVDAALTRTLAVARAQRSGASWWTTRRAGMALTVAAALMLFMLMPPVRSAADELLNAFRVKRFAVVKVDPATLSSLPHPQDLGSFSGAEPQFRAVGSVAEASRTTKMTVRAPRQLPASVGSSSEVRVSDPAKLAYTFDRAKLQAYLVSLGVAAKLPDNQPLRVDLDIPAQVMISYGSGKSRVVLSEGRSPTASVAPGLDVAGLRDQVLASLPAQMASQLRTIQDWTSTAVVPVPPGGSSQDLTVDGVSGVLVQGQQGGVVILWQRDGVLYALAGDLPLPDLISIANSLE